MKPTRQEVDKLFEREVIAGVIPSRDEFEKHILSGKSLHIYLGLDPTNTNVHLGHVQNILFLEDLRKLGARVTLLFGSFTGLVGDPTDKDAARTALTRKQVHAHMRTWKKQVAPLLRLSLFSNARIAYNNTWFDLFSMEDFLTLMRETTVQQLLERDMFQQRITSEKPLYTHELMYPILQGYDSVAMQVDAELCGTDQTFNALMGRTMVRRFLDKEKFVITMNLIEGDGVLMSKSNGTGVFVDVEKSGNHRMFGSIMALNDSFILPLFRGCTRIPMDEVRTLNISGGVATRDVKLRLAREVVGMFWGTRAANEAEVAYITQFREKGIPDTVPSITLSSSCTLSTFVAKHTEVSNARAKRQVKEGGVSVNDTKITDSTFILSKGTAYTVRAGRKLFTIV